MRFDVLTLFPEMFPGPLGLSLAGVRTALNVERGMELLRIRIKERREDGGPA